MPSPRSDQYASNGGRRDALGRDHALIWRYGGPAIVPLDEATPLELATGIASIEAQCIALVERHCSSRGVYLTDDRKRDAVSHLIASAWHEAGRFDGRGKLAAFVIGRLRWRLIDWTRLNLGRPADVEIVSFESLHESVAAPEPDESSDPFELLGVDRSALTSGATFALVELAYPMSCGETLTELCRRTGLSRHAAKTALDGLRLELEAAS